MKSLSAIVAAAYLTLTVPVVIALLVGYFFGFRVELYNSYWLLPVFIALTVIFGVICAVVLKSLSAIVAAAYLTLTVAITIALFIFGVGVDEIYWPHPVFIMLTVIYAAVSGVVSPQAPLTRAVFCGLTLLIGLFSLLGAILSLTAVEYGPADVVGQFGQPDYVVFSLAICMAGIAILNVLPSALARRSALLYGAYGLVIALWLADVCLTVVVEGRIFLMSFALQRL
jgi:hypothetical protein